MLGVVFFENTKGEGEAYWVRVVSKVGHTEKGYYIKLKSKFCDFFWFLSFLSFLSLLYLGKGLLPQSRPSSQKHPIRKSQACLP